MVVSEFYDRSPRGPSWHPSWAAQSSRRPFAVSVSHRHPGVTVVAVAGEVDILTCARLERQLEQALRDSRCRRLVVDLSKVDLLAACGIRCLHAAHTAAGPDIEMRLVVNTPPAMLTLRHLDPPPRCHVEATLAAACRD